MLLHYRLVEKIGEGGMGVVWKAVDTTLDREVAIKILPDVFTEDPDRLARFQREAKLLASLNHPGIAAVHGLHESGELRFIAMELVQGEDLAKRLTRGPLPTAEALSLALEIARALESAHERGVIHRDLKPANVVLTEEDKVKVLDFGLAKAFEPKAASGTNPSLSPTLTSAGTLAGVVLGTAAYMSPEQARGHPADTRSDVFSFAAVLFEMLSGRRAFQGDTITDTMAAVLKVEPNQDALPGDTPPRVRRMLARCLKKDRRDRMHAIGDARILLEEVLAGPLDAVDAEAAAATLPAWRRTLPWVLLAGMTGVAAIAFLSRGPVEVVPAEITRATIELPEEAPLAALWQGFASRQLSISPDGRTIVYASGVWKGVEDESWLVRKSLDSDAVERLPGTEGAWNPLFSPDGRWLAVVYGRRLSKIPVDGGAPVELARAAVWGGASWGPDGTIVFARSSASGISQVPADGGEVVELTEPDLEKDEVSHRLPFVLPGGKGVLFTIKSSDILDFDDAKIAVVSPESGEIRELIDGGTNPRYLPTGHVVYHHDGGLLAVPFDLDRLEVSGPPILLVDGVAYDPSTGSALYDVSETGTLVYVAGGALRAESPLLWVDRQGRQEPVTEQSRQYMDAQLSPDGKRMVVLLPAANNKLWMLDLERDILSRLTYGPGNDFLPRWSPDGQWIYFNSVRGGPGIYRVSADGGGEGEQVVDPPAFIESVSPDGRTLAFTRPDDVTEDDLWTVSTDDPSSAEPFLNTEFDEFAPVFSPDGGWLAYLSTESGEREIYLREYPGAGKKVQVTSGGVREYHWGPNGKEIFYLSNDGAWTTIPVELGVTPRIGKPRVLLENLREAPRDVSPDGQRFLMVSDEETAGRSEDGIRIVLNWFEGVRQRAR
jgi:serine/threonine-protein kinase